VVSVAAQAAPQTQTPQSRKYLALPLAAKGLEIFPLCCGDAEGKCACPSRKNPHTGRDIGKAPFTRQGYKDASSKVATIWNWWDEYPDANIGIALAASGIIAVAPDSPEWHGIFLSRGLPETAVARSGGGEGHLHYYYRAPAGTPLVRINKSDEYDIQSDGYMVAAGSLHQSGRTYEWISDYPWRNVEDLPFAPDWVLQELQAKADSQSAAPEIDLDPDLASIQVRAELLSGTLQEWWSGERVAPHEDGGTDRSLTLFMLGRLLAKQGASPEEIVSALRDRDEALGFDKYCRRKDGGRKAYSDIARTVTSSRPPQGDEPTTEFLSWEEITKAAAYDPAANSYKPGAAGPRRRFILPNDRGNIRHTRQRISKIWTATEASLGNQGVVVRAAQCGNLPRQDCGDCDTSFSSSKNKRRWCRARLHPTCMGVQMRQPLWDVQPFLEEEDRLQIGVVQLGAYDIGEDPFLWADQIKDKSKQAHHWVRRLTDPKRKTRLEALVNSFIGYRFDLHQGYLTMDLVILSPNVASDIAYLGSYFGEATEREVKIDTYDVSSATNAIDVFGNLMSCAVIYDDTLGCRAFLEGLKGQHMVQSRGRFRDKKKAKALREAKESSANISNTSPSGVLETNADAAESRRDHRDTVCPECGGTNLTYPGREPGDWRMVKSSTTGKPYWRLFDDPPEEERPDGQTRP
jgi:hypothetical protein